MTVDDPTPTLELPELQHLQVLQLNLMVVAEEEVRPEEGGPIEYDLSVMPSLTWAMIIGPYLHLPVAIPCSLSKLLLVSNNTNDDRFSFHCDLNSLDLLALITEHEECHICSGGFSGPRLFLHEGDPGDFAFPSDDNWYVLMARSAILSTVAEHLTSQVDRHGSHCRCDGGGAHLLHPFAP